MTESIIQAEFTHFKHIKTRKVVVLECEIPEELFQDAISKLGMPIGGESKPVAIALLDKNIALSSNGRKADFESVNCGSTPHEATNSEGEKLRIRAVMLCKDINFKTYINTLIPSVIDSLVSESEVSWYLKRKLGINSRSELAHNIEAQDKFKRILEDYRLWQSHGDNLNRL